LFERDEVPGPGIETSGLNWMIATSIATMITTTMNTTMDMSDLLQTGVPYGTIVADPPWPEPGGGGIKRGAVRHYPRWRSPTSSARPLLSGNSQSREPASHKHV
jgi:hypothetical protein